MFAAPDVRVEATKKDAPYGFVNHIYPPTALPDPSGMPPCAAAKNVVLT
jgi:hypothetical protein